MRFFNPCKHDVTKSHSQRIKSYMPVHLSNVPDKNKDLPEYILIGTCGFSIYANLTFPKAIVNGSRATCLSIFPTYVPDKNKDLPEYILIGTCGFSIYANLTLPKAIVNRSRATCTCPSIFPTCLVKTKICQSTSLLAHAVFQSMQR